jgi:hypothetical protein
VASVAGFLFTSHLSAGLSGDVNHVAFDTIRPIARLKLPDGRHRVRRIAQPAGASARAVGGGRRRLIGSMTKSRWQ